MARSFVYSFISALFVVSGPVGAETSSPSIAEFVAEIELNSQAASTSAQSLGVLLNSTGAIVGLQDQSAKSAKCKRVGNATECTLPDGTVIVIAGGTVGPEPSTGPSLMVRPDYVLNYTLDPNSGRRQLSLGQPETEFDLSSFDSEEFGEMVDLNSLSTLRFRIGD